MSQQWVPLPSTLMGSSAALIEGESLRQAEGVLPALTRPHLRVGQGRAGLWTRDTFQGSARVSEEEWLRVALWSVGWKLGLDSKPTPDCTLPMDFFLKKILTIHSKG